MTTDWGIPDWRDPSAYGDTSQWSKNRWRWEFTRRREDYRSDFLNMAKEKEFWTEERLKEFIPEPENQRVLTVDEPGYTAQATLSLFEKYRLPALPNPAISEQPFDVIWFQPNSMCLYYPVSTKEAFEVDLEPGQLPIFFDLSAPLNAQLKEARETFLWAQRKYLDKVLQPRKHPTKWLMYLRVLDARKAGGSWSVIVKANVLGHRQAPQAARDAWGAAQALCFNWPD